MCFRDDDIGGLIYRVNSPLHLLLFETVDDHQHDAVRFGVFGIAFFDIGHRLGDQFVECVADVAHMHTDNPDRARFIETFYDDIDGFVRHEISNERVERVFPAEDETGERDYDAVDQHDGLADRKDGHAVDEQRHDITAVDDAAVAHHHAHANTDEHATEDRCQDRHIGKAMVEMSERQTGQHQDADDGKRREGPAELLETKHNEWNVE